MRKMTWMTVVCLGALAGLGASSAKAAMAESLKVTLPYAASVGKVTLPAGEYTIRSIVEDGNSSVIEISDGRGHAASGIAMEIDAPNGEAKTSTVVLRKDGDNYKIQKVFVEGQEFGYEFLSAAE